jgi:hypothetical protein
MAATFARRIGLRWIYTATQQTKALSTHYEFQLQVKFVTGADKNRITQNLFWNVTAKEKDREECGLLGYDAVCRF